MEDRVWALEGVVNFRDFGGYESALGGRVTTGKLYRSAHFNGASNGDIARLNGLDAAFIVDLRRPEERAHEPNRWPGPGVATLTSDEGPMQLPPHIAVLLEPELSPAKVIGFMRDVYASYPLEPRYRDLFRAYFQALLETERPAVIHCAAGKDRTGMLCAITLSALGVPEEAIIADYELTNVAVDLSARLPMLKGMIEGRLGRAVEEASLRPMIGVHRDYLAAAFAAIEAAGGMGAYLEREMGLDEAKLAALRARLLT